MDDQQFSQLMKVLNEIKDAVTPSSAYDIGDVCSKLDDVESAVKDVISAVKDIERN